MSKTFIYILAIISIYLFVIAPKVSKDNTDIKDNTNDTESTNESTIKKGANGRLQYQIGYVK